MKRRAFFFHTKMTETAKTIVESWGLLTHDAHHYVPLPSAQEAGALLREGLPGIAYGMGRSYGDVCLNPGGTLWAARPLNRFISFDEESGVLQCEAGVLLREIQRHFVPRGWMLPVTPGTQIVTVGGAIANDIHGKSHHVVGSFGHHVRGIRLARTDGQVLDIAPEGEHAALFAATVGGMGLTGVMLSAALQMRRVTGPWLEAENVPFGSLDEFFDINDATAPDEWPYTVSWIDCLAWKTGTRGIYMRGRHATGNVMGEPPGNLQLTVPLTPPMSLINSLSLRAFNMGYYWLQRMKTERSIVHYEPFFYPLDNVHEWNRIYGPRGFYQYQSVVPMENGREAVREMFEAIGRSGQGSFLAVLKTMGDMPAAGMMSFPMGGVTLALDFPECGERTRHLFERLDAIVREAGGRIYLAKDARWPRELFEAAYPRLQEFLPHRDPGISSALSRRLMGS